MLFQIKRVCAKIIDKNSYLHVLQHLAESRGSSRFLSFKKKLFLISGTFKFFLFTGAIFERIFPPRGKPWDLDESCFPYTFGPTFMPPIHFWRRTQKKLNHFYPTVISITTNLLVVATVRCTPLQLYFKL